MYVSLLFSISQKTEEQLKKQESDFKSVTDNVASLVKQRDLAINELSDIAKSLGEAQSKVKTFRT